MENKEERRAARRERWRVRGKKIKEALKDPEKRAKIKRVFMKIISFIKKRRQEKKNG